MSKLKYHKVVYEMDGHLISSYIRGRAAVEYKVGEWAETQKHKQEEGWYLCIFDSMKNAQWYIKNLLLAKPSYFTYSCDIDEEAHFPKYLPDDGSISLSMTPIRFKPLFPEGTVMAKRVKLLEKVNG